MDGCTVCWVKIWLDGQAQGAVGTGATSSWWSLTAGVLQGTALGPVLLNLFIVDLDEGRKVPSVSLDRTPSWVGVLICQGAGRLCRDLDRLDGQTEADGLRFNKGKCWLCTLATTTP